MLSFGSGEALLRINNIGFAYPGTEHLLIIQNLSIELRAGACIQITGRNGAGKSTLLKLLGGDLSPTNGSREELVADLNPIYFHQDLLKFVGRTLTIREQLLVPYSRNTTSRDKRGALSLEEYIALATSWLEEFDLGLQQRLDDFIESLSGGQRQVIAFVSALLSPTRLLLLDEFTSALDSRSVLASGRILKSEVNKGRIALVAVNHQLGLLGIKSQPFPVGPQCFLGDTAKPIDGLDRVT